MSLSLKYAIVLICKQVVFVVTYENVFRDTVDAINKFILASIFFMYEELVLGKFPKSVKAFLNDLSKSDYKPTSLCHRMKYSYKNTIGVYTSYVNTYTSHLYLENPSHQKYRMPLDMAFEPYGYCISSCTCTSPKARNCWTQAVSYLV